MSIQHDNQWLKPIGGTVGGLIGSMWGPIGNMAGKAIGNDAGGMLGDLYAGNWSGVGQNFMDTLQKGMNPMAGDPAQNRDKADAQQGQLQGLIQQMIGQSQGQKQDPIHRGEPMNIFQGWG